MSDDTEDDADDADDENNDECMPSGLHLVEQADRGAGVGHGGWEEQPDHQAGRQVEEEGGEPEADCHAETGNETSGRHLLQLQLHLLWLSVGICERVQPV